MEYKGKIFHLIDEFIDVGYMAEDVEGLSGDGKEMSIKKTNPNRDMQVLLAYPNFEDFKDDILEFDEFISGASVGILSYVIFAKRQTLPKFKSLMPFIDANEDFALMYGAKIVDGEFKDLLTKSLFIIGKDGAIYHVDMPENLENPFNMDVLRASLNKAYMSYTGVGCHG